MMFLVLLAMGGVALCGWYFFLRDPRRSRAFSEARWFQEKVNDFRQHTRTLEAHSDEYCAVFSDNEWSKLNDTLSRLEQVDRDVQELLFEKRYAQALAILHKVNSPAGSKSPLDELDHELHHIQDLINWQHSLHAMLKKVVLNLEVAATNTKNLSAGKPATTPRPTLVTLADIKKVLLEDDEIRKMSS
jgi:hypothetical protein